MFATPEIVQPDRALDDARWGITNPNHEQSCTQHSDLQEESSKKMSSLMSLVEATVLDYRLQSPSHFALHIDVQPQDSNKTPAEENKPHFKTRIVFSNYEKEIRRQCFRLYRRGRPTNKVTVREKGVGTPLKKSLARNFPPTDAIVSECRMQMFWDSNGKVFDWTNLPTELKEHIIQYCVTNPPPYEDYFHCIRRPHRFKAYKYHPCEIVERLGDWRGLLLASTQVRAITLRLCFTGSLLFDKGFCITSYRYVEFQHRWKQLAKHYQVVEPNGVPFDVRTRALAIRYDNFPKQFPALKQFATFRHGIRKICLSFDFISFLHFFKVTVGGFDQYNPGHFLTCDIFERLPHLNAIVILLPWNRKDHWKDVPTQYGPPLFHDTFPCPRVLYRLVYERIAVELASYKDVTVTPFLSTEEEERFWNMREAAILSLKFSDEDFKELYAECGGGIDIEEECDEETQTLKTKSSSSVDDGCYDFVQDFFPPRCGCNEPCKKVFNFYATKWA